MRFLRRSLVGLFLLSVTLVVLAMAGQTVRGAIEERRNAEGRAFPQRERVLAVNVVAYTPETITPELTIFGELRSQRTLELRAGVGGTVMWVAPEFVEGGTVTAGQPLLRIDEADARATFDRAMADSQDAEAELRDAERGLILAQDELAAADAQSALREQALTRQRDLQTRGVGTAANVEDAELAVSSAWQSVLSRRQALAQAEARVDQARTRQARGNISLAEAQRTLDDTEISARFAGTLSGVTVIDGGRVTPNEQIAQLVDPSQLEVSFRVSTSQYARLLDDEGRLKRAPVAVTLDVSGVDLRASGVITRESAAVAEGQTGRLLFATLQEAPAFRPGDFVTVRVEEPPLQWVARVPATALAADNSVLAIGEEERLEIVYVDLLRRQGDDVLIRSRDLVDRTIVAERSPILGAGIKVRPISPDAAGAEPEPPAMVTLEPDRKARLVAFVEASRMPAEAKTRILGQLDQAEVPAAMVARLESRMGS